MDVNNPGQTPPAPVAPQSNGLGENVASALCYLGGWITGIVFLVIEKNNKVIRFHAAQSLVLFGGLQILMIVLPMTIILAMLTPIVFLIWIILWVVMMYKAYQGGVYKLPVIGAWAEKISQTN